MGEMTYHSMVNTYFVEEAPGIHLAFLPFSAERDIHLLKYKLADLHKSIFHLNAFNNEVHWETRG